MSCIFLTASARQNGSPRYHTCTVFNSISWSMESRGNVSDMRSARESIASALGRYAASAPGSASGTSPSCQPAYSARRRALHAILRANTNMRSSEPTKARPSVGARYKKI